MDQESIDNYLAMGFTVPEIMDITAISTGIVFAIGTNGNMSQDMKEATLEQVEELFGLFEKKINEAKK